MDPVHSSAAIWRHSNNQSVVKDGVELYEWSFLGYLPAYVDKVSWVRVRNYVNYPVNMIWELRTAFEQLQPPTSPPTPVYYSGDAREKPWLGEINLSERDDSELDAEYTEPVTQPVNQQLYAPVSGKPIEPPEYSVAPTSVGGLTSTSMSESIFLARWDTGRGPTSADTSGLSYSTGAVMEYTDAVSMLIRSADMSFFNIAVDDSTKPSVGRVYVSKIDSWMSYPGKPDFGRPGGDIHVTSRFFARASGYLSGVAVADGQSYGSREAAVPGRLLSSRFTETRSLSPNLTVSQVRGLVSSTVRDVTGWDVAPYTYNISTGVLSYHVGF
uniref:Uncharacterized protein n=1 Tax=Erysiphales associated tombus-like virus 1 TaxID=2754852 RepID=A0A7D6ERI2_9TOMB|nr:hypothetical protein [Erysiphales associated tombus-like virus 1]